MRICRSFYEQQLYFDIECIFLLCELLGTDGKHRLGHHEGIPELLSEIVFYTSSHKRDKNKMSKNEDIRLLQIIFALMGLF